MPASTAILGLSADPPHLGHLAASRFLRDMGYDAVWWMVTPQNPDKPTARAPFAHRLELCRLLAQTEPDWLHVSDFEATLDIPDPNQCTYVLLSRLAASFPHTAFTFVMGADNWADATGGVHTWGRYQDFLAFASLLVLPREPWSQNLTTCPAAQTLAPQHDAASHGPVTPGHWRIAHGFVPHPAASRHIRADFGRHAPEALLPTQIAYIRQHGLYLPVADAHSFHPPS